MDYVQVIDSVWSVTQGKGARSLLSRIGEGIGPTVILCLC